MADITHLRKMSGAGMMDCKKALEEADNDFEKAMEIIRKKGQAVAAKRSDREAAEGCVLAADEGGFAAIVALKCETDFVAKNADFVALTQDILNAAMTGKPASKEALLAATLQGGRTVENHITDRIGVTGEKMELGYYESVQGAATVLLTANADREYRDTFDEVQLFAVKNQMEHGRLISPQFPVLVVLDILYADYMNHDAAERDRIWQRTYRALQRNKEQT